jgi:tagaturonate reductase
LVDVLNEQSGEYTVVVRGLQDGRLIDDRIRIGCVSRGIDPYQNFDAFLEAARIPELRFAVSNTTEAGIAHRAEDRFEDAPPVSFPGKLTRFLYERYAAGLPGLVLLPCELIDRNGDNLKQTVLEAAANWGLSPAFTEWISSANVFTNTLVDRIVTGYPHDEAATMFSELGYEDKLLDTCEPFQFWAIEGPAEIAQELPLTQAGFDVVWTDDLKPYRDRKVHILNGAHTCMTMIGLLAGKETVGECMEDPAVRAWVEGAIYEEIIPTLTLPRAELERFAESVLERFRNPFIRHRLMSIALNSVSKYRARVLPSVERFTERNGRPPQKLAQAMAGLIEVYGSGRFEVQDDPAVLEFFRSRPAVGEVLGRVDWWGQDLRGLAGFEKAVTDFAGHR